LLQNTPSVMDVEYETCNHIDSLARWSVLTVSHNSGVVKSNICRNPGKIPDKVFLFSLGV